MMADDALTHTLQDLAIVRDHKRRCCDCFRLFLFTAADQRKLRRRFQDDYQPPSRCPSCRELYREAVAQRGQCDE
jgi:hypothetical protein